MPPVGSLPPLSRIEITEPLAVFRAFSCRDGLPYQALRRKLRSNFLGKPREFLSKGEVK
jgi:hypothetical protein